MCSLAFEQQYLISYKNVSNEIQNSNQDCFIFYFIGSL